ncbi:hypothetical protein D3C71_1833160 [compost metagenome]
MAAGLQLLERSALLLCIRSLHREQRGDPPPRHFLGLEARHGEECVVRLPDDAVHIGFDDGMGTVESLDECRTGWLEQFQFGNSRICALTRVLI